MRQSVSSARKLGITYASEEEKVVQPRTFVFEFRVTNQKEGGY